MTRQTPDQSGISRSEFLKRAGGFTAGALSLGGVSTILAGNATPALAASAKAHKIAALDQALDAAHEESFNNPINAYLKAKAHAWTATYGNENNTVTTGLTLAAEYAAAKYPVFFLLTADAMSDWQTEVGKMRKQGMLVFNHGTQAVRGASCNVLFSHKQAGLDVGAAAVAWAKRQHLTAPVVGIIGFLTDAQAIKRTTFAWKTIKAAFPHATLAGSVNAIDAPTGATAAANLLSAHPTIDILICFNAPAGTGALTSAHQAGKTDPSKFFLGVTDFEPQTLALLEKGGTVMQANYGSYFPQSAMLMARDAIANVMHGTKILPTRLILGTTLTTSAQAKKFNDGYSHPLAARNAGLFKSGFKYLDVNLATAQTPPGQ
jgi:ABC-type sugar transport system substrate-binding protein